MMPTDPEEYRNLRKILGLPHSFFVVLHVEIDAWPNILDGSACDSQMWRLSVLHGSTIMDG